MYSISICEELTPSDVVCVDSNSSSPTVTHVTPQGNGVGRVTSLGHHQVTSLRNTFVVRRPSEQKIDDYRRFLTDPYSSDVLFSQ